MFLARFSRLLPALFAGIALAAPAAAQSLKTAPDRPVDIGHL